MKRQLGRDDMPRKKKEQKATKVSRVVLVLDRSGSMESCRDATISGFSL